MVLLHLLRRKLKPHQIVVAHFDHLTRPESSYQAEQLKQECSRWGLQQFVLSRRRGNKKDEESLRNERHAFLKRVVKKTNSQYLALGHNANDQLETILMRFLRGTGLYGLSGMRERNKTLIRPLLNIAKGEIVDYAEKRRLTIFEDQTNQEQKYFRNKIRHRLIPVLNELSLQYGGEQKLLSRTLSLSDEVSQQKKADRLLARKWIKRNIHKSPTWWCFPIKKWDSLTKGVQRSVAELIWKELVGETLETKEVRLLQQAAKLSKTVVLSGKVVVRFSCGKAYFQSPDQHRVQLKFLKSSPDTIEELVSSGAKKELREKVVKLNAELRFLKAGDRHRGKKMKRRCLEARIPAPERCLLPVVALKESHEVLWYFTQPGEFKNLVHPIWSSIPKAQAK